MQNVKLSFVLEEKRFKVVEEDRTNGFGIGYDKGCPPDSAVSSLPDARRMRNVPSQVAPTSCLDGVRRFRENRTRQVFPV